MSPSTLDVPEDCGRERGSRPHRRQVERARGPVTLGRWAEAIQRAAATLIASTPQRMLALTSRGSERDGLVTRTVFPTIPPRVDYELTELGRSLLQPVGALGSWARENRSRISQARLRSMQRDGVIPVVSLVHWTCSGA